MAVYHVLSQFVVGRESFLIEASRGPVETLEIANPGELDPLVGVDGLVLATEDRWKPDLEFNQPLAFSYPQCG